MAWGDMNSRRRGGLAVALLCGILIVATARSPARAQDTQASDTQASDTQPAETQPEATSPPITSLEDMKSWTLNDLRAGTRVEVDGHLRPDGSVEADRVTFERADSTPEINGTIASIDFETLRISIPPFTIQVTADTDIDDESEMDSYRFDELTVGWHLDVDVRELPDGTLEAVEIAVDTVTDNDKIGVIEIEAFIQSVGGQLELDTLTIRLLGHDVKVGEDTPLRVQEGATKRNVSATSNVEDEVRGLIKINLGSTELIIGGELQFGQEVRERYELDSHNHRDTATRDLQISLQAEWFLTNSLLLYLKGSSSREDILYDGDRSLKDSEVTHITEAYVKYNIPEYPFLVQVGRQRFDDDREWYYDGELDGARVNWTSGRYSVEYSYSEILRDNHLLDEFKYQIMTARYQYDKRGAVTLHVLDIVDDSPANQSPLFLGLAAVGRWKGEEHAVKYWAQYAYVDGVTGTEDLEAHAYDFGAAIQWRNAPLAPYIFAGFAEAEGDNDPTNGTNREFRQSGLQDNNDKLFGVSSYRYYGELFRPELSNMRIWTLGAGIRPHDSVSVDFVFHTYRQDVASASIRDSRIRTNPSGLDADLGVEFDIVVGLADLWGSWDLEFDFGYFVPGDAFDVAIGPGLFQSADTATWLALQIEYKF